MIYTFSINIYSVDIYIHNMFTFLQPQASYSLQVTILIEHLRQCLYWSTEIGNHTPTGTLPWARDGKPRSTFDQILHFNDDFYWLNYRFMKHHRPPLLGTWSFSIGNSIDFHKLFHHFKRVGRTTLGRRLIEEHFNAQCNAPTSEWRGWLERQILVTDSSWTDTIVYLQVHV